MSSPSEQHQQLILDYIKAFETLTPKRLRAQLEPLFHADAYFQDPFNQLNGIENIIEIFDHKIGRAHV